MVTAAGFNARSTCAAIHAGISGVQVDNLWDPGAGKYLSLGRPRTSQWWEGADMMAELAAPAIAECLKAIPTIPPQNVPIFLLLSPPSRPHRDPNLEEEVARGLEHRLKYVLPSGSQCVSRGRTGIFHALNQASLLFQNRQASHCIIAGVDSYLRQAVVEAYIERRRLLTESNSNGFISGEAACAVLVEPAGSLLGEALRITGWGLANEPGTIDSDQPLTGNGLTEALRDALSQAGIQFSDADYWLTDQNGEHYKFKEAMVAKIRLERNGKQPRQRRFEIWHPIEYLGEIGAAIAPCLLGVALAAHRIGYAPGPRALLHVSEDEGERTAFVLEWGTEKK
jgi:3-oxoacyl-[acyl-carrier-protein] synthase I